MRHVIQKYLQIYQPNLTIISFLFTIFRPVFIRCIYCTAGDETHETEYSFDDKDNDHPDPYFKVGPDAAGLGVPEKHGTEDSFDRR